MGVLNVLENIVDSVQDVHKDVETLMEEQVVGSALWTRLNRIEERLSNVLMQLEEN